ncbi:MAG: diguanylate cyclase [Candidatus Omnitrophica bacterium]|nr:diguanylate cyclase [Candidatus Omnitrophota bacterium]
MKKKNNIRYKLKISFFLLLIIPVLISIYTISLYTTSFYKWKSNVLILTLVGFFIGLSGFLLIYELIRRLLKISSEVKSITEGKIDTYIYQTEDDELTELAEAINSLQIKIRTEMEQLNAYSKKTSEYNLKLQRQSLVLSSLLQINSLISSGENLDDILKLTLERIRRILDSEVAYLLLKEEESGQIYIRCLNGLDIPEVINLKVNLKPQIKDIFERSIKEHSVLKIDSKTKFSEELIQEFFETFKIKNALFLPMYSRNRFLGFLGTGNNQQNFVYKEDDVEIMEIFSKNILIIIETDRLLSRLNKLEIKDSLTGLYNERFIYWRLEEEIKRSMLYQRPCGFVLFRIDDFKTLYERFGVRFTEEVLKKVAVLIKESISEVDYTGRFGDYSFAVILVEKNKRQTMEVAEYIRKKIEFAFAEEESEKRITVTAAISENPLDGISAEELIRKAEQILRDFSQDKKNIVIDK